MVPGGPQQLRYSLEVMPSDPRRRVGVQLHVVCVPVATVVGFAMVVGCRCCLPGWSCVLWEHWGVWIEKLSPVSACWRLGRHRGSAAAVIYGVRLSALASGARTSDTPISSTGALPVAVSSMIFKFPSVILTIFPFCSKAC